MWTLYVILCFNGAMCAEEERYFFDSLDTCQVVGSAYPTEDHLIYCDNGPDTYQYEDGVWTFVGGVAL